MKKFYKTIILFLVCYYSAVQLNADSSEKEIYAFIINTQDEAIRQEIEKKITEISNSMGIIIHREGLKLNNSMESLVRFCRLGFLKSADFEVLDQNMTGVVQGSLCGDSISDKSFFFVANRETLLSVDSFKSVPLDFSRKLKEELRKIKRENTLVFITDPIK